MPQQHGSVESSEFKILLNTKEEFTTWALRFLTIFPHTFKILPIMLGNLKSV
jgi:hypothetical protein